ncbi:MAG: hypothetical protein QOF58_4723 [Pseudonocardiales bacterium]|nr:hypothetical protein [Pseudonocardiales bacterium]
MSRGMVRQAPWGLLDQGLSSGTNLLLTLLVARELSAQDFGGFSLCYVVYMLAVGLARATGNRPFTIEHALSDTTRFREEARGLLGYSLAFALVCGLFLMAAGLASNGPVATGLLVLAILVPGLLLQDAVRGIFFAQRAAEHACLNDAIWAVLQLSALAGLLIAVPDPPLWAFLVAWGVPGAVAALCGLLQLRLVPMQLWRPRWIKRYRRLSLPLASNLLLTALPAYLLYLAMPALSDLRQLGILRGAYVFFGPLNVVFTGVSLVALPAVLRLLASQSGRRLSNQLSLVLGLVAAAWGLLVVLLPDAAGEAILGPIWDDTRAARLWLAVSLVAEAVLVGPETIMSGLGRPARMTAVRSIGAGVTLAVGVALTLTHGAVGAAAGFAIGYWTAAILAVFEASRLTGILARVQPESMRVNPLAGSAMIDDGYLAFGATDPADADRT